MTMKDENKGTYPDIYEEEPRIIYAGPPLPGEREEKTIQKGTPSWALEHTQELPVLKELDTRQEIGGRMKKSIEQLESEKRNVGEHRKR